MILQCWSCGVLWVGWRMHGGGESNVVLREREMRWKVRLPADDEALDRQRLAGRHDRHADVSLST